MYSGNFLAEAEVEPFGTTRIRLGIEPDTFAWRLEPGEAFTTPEAVVVWTAGVSAGSATRSMTCTASSLARGTWRDRPRPVLLNNWEGTYFDFDADRLVEIARAARDLGIELFVLDDGWFGHRDADDSSLGDWVPDRRKLPDGLDGLGRRITELGIGFGLWIEPEMVSADSDLFRAHPDWAIGIPGRPRTESRQQLVLDMGRPEVVDHLAESLGSVLASAPVTYVKWDMNRNITEPYGVDTPARPSGRVLPPLHPRRVRAVPAPDDALPGDPVRVVRQRRRAVRSRDAGLRPPDLDQRRHRRHRAAARSSGGRRWSIRRARWAPTSPRCPNHQTGRVTPLETRAAVAFFGVFGYELDPTTLDGRRAGSGARPGRLLPGAPRDASNTAASIDC